MNLYLAFIIILTLVGIKIHVKTFNHDYLSPSVTSCVKGIFVLIIFYSHLANDYIVVDSAKDGIMHAVKVFLGQLMVASFLLYSGYGVYEQIKKRPGYVRTIPTVRFPKVWIRMAFSVFLFAIVQVCLGRIYPLKRYLLTLAAWEGIGNSNWYIFAICIEYLITWAAFTVWNDNHKSSICAVFAGTAIFMLFMAKHKEAYWYNTVLCYPFGMILSYNKENLTEALTDNTRYALTFLSALLAFWVLGAYKAASDWYYSIYAVLFSFLVVLATAKIELRSPFLKWFGDNVFWMYILQRIPMLILKQTGYMAKHTYRAALIAFAATACGAFLCTKLFTRIDAALFGRRKKQA